MTSLARRVNRVSIVVGILVWLVLAWFSTITVIPRLLLLAALTIIPLALGLLASDDKLIAVITLLQPIAAAFAVAAFLTSPGLVAGGLAAVWLGFTGLVGLKGGLHLRAHRLTSAAEACMAAGMLYLPIGGAWLVASRLGLGLLGFGEPIVSLTAIHFHYAGFAALVIAGLTGRALAARRTPPSRTYQVVTVGLIAGMALVAAGITISPVLEVAAAVVFAASIIGLVAIQVRYIVPDVARLPQVLFGGSAIMAMIAMLAAVTYAVGEFTGGDWITIPQMLRVHGEANALGFVLCNLLAWKVAVSE